MNYCKDCGEKINKITDSEFVCDSCGNKYYINPKGATALLLLDNEGRLILGRRGQEPNMGKQDCIGGFVDFGENFEAGMLRELNEESGLGENDIEELKYLGSTYDPYEWQGRIVPVVSVYFVSKLVSSKELIASDDIASFEHVKIEDVKREDIAWDGMWEMIKKLESSSGF
jgi:ADP-ribose pyrophosphatase YjhB (NUDIX family)